MKTFIFITHEGQTFAPNENIEVENMQVIGILDEVNNEDDALRKLLKENSWIEESGFNVAEFIAYDIVKS